MWINCVCLNIVHVIMLLTLRQRIQQKGQLVGVQNGDAKMVIWFRFDLPWIGCHELTTRFNHYWEVVTIWYNVSQSIIPEYGLYMEILWMEVITMGFALFLRYVHLRYMTICEKIRLQTWPTRTSVHIYTYLDKHASLIDDMILKLWCMICLLYERITHIYIYIYVYI